MSARRCRGASVPRDWAAARAEEVALAQLPHHRPRLEQIPQIPQIPQPHDAYFRHRRPAKRGTVRPWRRARDALSLLRRDLVSLRWVRIRSDSGQTCRAGVTSRTAAPTRRSPRLPRHRHCRSRGPRPPSCASRSASAPRRSRGTTGAGGLELERRTNDDVAVVELPRHQAAAVPPIKQALTTTLGDTVELAVRRLRSASVTG